MKLGSSSPRLVLLFVAVVLAVVLSVVTAQEFRSIGTFRSDISAPITTLEFPPYCSKSHGDDNDKAALPQVPSHLPITILPGSTNNNDVWDIRTTPPNLVQAVLEDGTLRFFWNPSVLNNNNDNNTSSNTIRQVGMLIQVPASSSESSRMFQSLVIRDGGVQLQILEGAANQLTRIDMSTTSMGISTLDLILEEGNDDEDSTTTTLLDLTLEGPGTSATLVTNTKRVGNVLVQDDANLSLNGNIHGSLTVEKATMQWKGEFVLEEEDSSTSTTTTITTPTIASKGLLTTTDALVCQVATLELAGECQVDTTLQIEAQVTGALSRSIVVEQQEETTGNNTGTMEEGSSSSSSSSSSSFQTCVAAPIKNVQSSSAVGVTAVTGWTRLLGVLVVSIMVVSCC